MPFIYILNSSFYIFHGCYLLIEHHISNFPINQIYFYLLLNLSLSSSNFLFSAINLLISHPLLNQILPTFLPFSVPLLNSRVTLSTPKPVIPAISLTVYDLKITTVPILINLLFLLIKLKKQGRMQSLQYCPLSNKKIPYYIPFSMNLFNLAFSAFSFLNIYTKRPSSIFCNIRSSIIFLSTSGGNESNSTTISEP